MAKGVWGIDVSKNSVKAVRLAGSGDALTLTNYVVIPYDPVDPGDGDTLDRRIHAALEDLKVQAKIGSEPVVFSMPSHSTFNRLIKLPPVDDAKLGEIVQYEAQQQIPFNIEEVIWDYQYIDRIYSPGEEKEVLLFAIKRDIVEQFLSNLKDLFFTVEAVQFGPVALFNFMNYDQELETTCVALDMGGDNTDLIVIEDKKFWIRNLPITGNDITKALQKAFNIPFNEAEELKLKAGQTNQAQKIFNAIQPILRDLVNEINRSMGYYKSISHVSKFDKIFLLGNSARTINFQRFLSQSLQLTAARIEGLKKVQVGGGVDAGTMKTHLSGIGTAMGLALQGAEVTVNTINLLPPAYIKKKEIKKKQPFMVAAVALLYIIVGIMWYQATSEVARSQSIVKKATDMQTQVNKAHDALNAVMGTEREEKAIETVKDLALERDLVLKIMDHINPNIPNNGDAKLPSQDCLWVVDWTFEEHPTRPKVAVTQGGRRVASRIRLLSTERTLSSTIHVVITKRNSDAEGRKFIIRKLLNYVPQPDPKLLGKAANSALPCAINNKYWQLFEGDGWSVNLDNQELKTPLPKNLEQYVEEDDSEKEPGYWRYHVTLRIPVGDDQRHPPEEKPAATNGTGSP